jgi:ABC-type glycerol-3-phosphate transport system substrate-binding protein
MLKRFKVIGLLLGLLSAIISNTQAQQIITVNVPFFWEMLIDESVVEQFEAEHGVDVQFIYGDSAVPAPSNADDVEAYLEEMTDYASSADVLYVEPFTLTPEAVRAGFFVDLMPLVTADAQLNTSDFHAAVWEAYQWDGGMWALPTAAQTVLIDYVPQKFDEAGLVYPDANWTMDDYINVARELTQYDDAGNVTVPGMMIGNGDALVRSMFTEGFTNPGTSPADPSFTSPQLAELLEEWLGLLAEGVVAESPDMELLNEIPIRIGSGDFALMSVRVGGDDEEDSESSEPRDNFFDTGLPRSLAPLPGNTGGLEVNGFAVSSGSSQPQLAYELVRYLTEQQAIANAVPGAEPARYSYTTPENVPANDTVVVFGGEMERSPEDEAIVQHVLDNGINTADMRYSHYFDNVLQYIMGDGLTVTEALEMAEADALGVMAAIDSADVQFSVAPVETVVLAEGEIALDFGLMSFIRPLPNEEEWDALIAEFAAQDPEVGAVNVNLGFPNELVSGNDCSYLALNFLEDNGSEGLLALDPLVFSDPNYDINSVPASALEALRVNGMLYGLPITLTPEILNYNPTHFASAGLAEPVDGWTMDEFIDALQQLKTVLPEDEYPFVSQSFGSSYLLLLIAAQGGLPIDFSTDPITIDFTSPETVAAIQAVLDLAKDGYINYQALGQMAGGVGVFIVDDSNIPAIAAANVLAGGGRGPRNVVAVDPITTTYPTGTTYTPVSYQVGAGYINATTEHPEACYRWLSFLANHPHVLNAMPALLSTLSQPELTVALGEDTVSTYQHFADLLNAPNAINLSTTDFFISQWLNQAFDAYVLEDADLLTALQDAEQKTRDYLSCTSQLAEDANFEDYLACVESVG